MTRVEYRFFQYQIHITSGDKVTLGLVFWDGQRLRFAGSLGMLPRGLAPEEQPLLERALQSLETRLTVANETARQGASLQEVFPVREGIGSSLFWSELRGGQTVDVEGMFRDLSRDLDLEPRDIWKNSIRAIKRTA